MRILCLPAILAIGLMGAPATWAGSPQGPQAVSGQPSPEVEALTAKIRTAMANAIEANEGMDPAQIELAVSAAVEDVIAASGADPLVVQAALRLALAREQCLLLEDQRWNHVGCEGLNRVASAVDLAIRGPTATGNPGGIATPGTPPPPGTDGRGPDYRRGN